MENLKFQRIIDTFPAIDLELKRPNVQNTMDSLSEYSLREGYGLNLRRRRRKRHKQIVL